MNIVQYKFINSTTETKWDGFTEYFYFFAFLVYFVVVERPNWHSDVPSSYQRTTEFRPLELQKEIKHCHYDDDDDDDDDDLQSKG